MFSEIEFNNSIKRFETCAYFDSSIKAEVFAASYLMSISPLGLEIYSRNNYVYINSHNRNILQQIINRLESSK